ncbi:CinA family protein [Nocardioides mangrovicus]|uniref:CinA family protein n=1 Tax=Nocardioides mangrovicus TaxID=2478913 RepID=A0A3L8P4D4_9ACTN|nr:CinA family protein [Nocardioides mangrovicus]
MEPPRHRRRPGHLRPAALGLRRDAAAQAAAVPGVPHHQARRLGVPAHGHHRRHRPDDQADQAGRLHAPGEHARWCAAPRRHPDRHVRLVRHPRHRAGQGGASEVEPGLRHQDHLLDHELAVAADPAQPGRSRHDPDAARRDAQRARRRRGLQPQQVRRPQRHLQRPAREGGLERVDELHPAGHPQRRHHRPDVGAAGAARLPDELRSGVERTGDHHAAACERACEDHQEAQDEEVVTAADVHRLLAERGQTLATAESLTGGRLASLLTDVAGASATYVGGVVSYATSVKEQVLAVPVEVIREHGVVSAECARAMAEGVRGLVGADRAVATTGVAGPTEQEGKPVGTVFVGLAGPEGTEAIALHLSGDREAIRQQTCEAALEELVAAVSGRGR